MKSIAMLCGACLLGLNYGVSAQIRSISPGKDYPSKPVRLIATSSAGGPVDALARLVGAKLTEALGQTAIIDNRDGASGMIGCQLAARSAPDWLYPAGRERVLSNECPRSENQAAVRSIYGFLASHPNGGQSTDTTCP